MYTRRTRDHRAILAIVVPTLFLALCFLRPAGAAEPAAADTAAARLKSAVSDMRNAGTAMYAWYLDALEPRRHKGRAATPDLEDVAKVPLISYADLAKTLVPKYIRALPQTDPWGHPYEYRLSQDPEADEVMVVRSAGAHGAFSGNVYKVGGFPAGDASQDLVWKDGYFVRWPELPEMHTN